MVLSMMALLAQGSHPAQFFYKVRLLNIDLTVGEGLNVDANLVIQGPLIFNIKLGLYLRDCLGDCYVFWRGKYAAIHVDNEDYFTLIENAAVYPGILESYLFQSFSERLVPHPRSLPLTINNIEDLNEVICTDSSIGFDTSGNLCVHVELYVGLSKVQDKVHLTCTPYIEYKKDQNHPNSEPIENR